MPGQAADHSTCSKHTASTRLWPQAHCTYHCVDICTLVICLHGVQLQVQPGDIVVTGSDGLWDNIFAEEAATIASKCRDKGETATTAAQVLCR